ncbi:MAG: zinc ribbon domain-containing protein [Candidatus Nanoarchaeia archaeon]
MTQKPCESCAMPIREGKYCKYCAPSGKLLPLSAIIENMSRIFAKKQGLTEEQAFERTIAYLKRMPAWRDKLGQLEKS